ncbi:MULTISPECIES: DNA-binding transcriptional repressor YgbI [Yersinia]|uniref:DNA-binding transcriptional repressor YgbI n=1 Tax=Yersinia TaxID=629 RepID=UPI0011AAAA75|nr:MULTISPECIES: DNA-binding transcriptional repressor YgbI [Yersinia]
MIPVERHQQILALVAERGVVSITELTERLGVSHMTIRRDVQKLEEQGAVLAVSGGVRSTERLTAEPSHQDKTQMYSSQKNAIGMAAALHIPRNSCIYLDAGTTTLALARQLEARDDLLVVTNDFVIANFLIESCQCKMIHSGGTLCRENRSCVGDAAARSLRNLSIDIAFISASCWGPRGISTPSEDKVVVKRAVSEVSSKHVLLTDASKYGKISTYLALPLTDFDVVITDASLSSTAQDELAAKEIELIITQVPRQSD